MTKNFGRREDSKVNVWVLRHRRYFGAKLATKGCGGGGGSSPGNRDWKKERSEAQGGGTTRTENDRRQKKFSLLQSLDPGINGRTLQQSTNK